MNYLLVALISSGLAFGIGYDYGSRSPSSVADTSTTHIVQKNINYLQRIHRRN